MRKQRIYLDTSVISHLEQADTPDKMADTRLLWEEIKQDSYDVYISEVVLRELSANNESKQVILARYLAEIKYTTIAINKEMEVYADKLINENILTIKNRNDCLHIASAVTNECHILLSWNFKHIVRIKTVNGVRSISAMLGYKGIDIIPPSMIVERRSD